LTLLAINLSFAGDGEHLRPSIVGTHRRWIIQSWAGRRISALLAMLFDIDESSACSRPRFAAG